METFNVIIEDNGKFKPYNVIPYLVDQYNRAKTKPKDHNEFMDFVEKEAKYQWWSRTEYEVILSDWPCQKVSEKIDVYQQVHMNLSTVASLLMKEVLGKSGIQDIWLLHKFCGRSLQIVN